MSKKLKPSSKSMSQEFQEIVAASKKASGVLFPLSPYKKEQQPLPQQFDSTIHRTASLENFYEQPKMI